MVPEPRLDLGMIEGLCGCAAEGNTRLAIDPVIRSPGHRSRASTVAVASMSSNVVGVGLPKALTPLRTSSDPAILALVKHTTPEPRPRVRQPRAKAPPHRPHNPRQAAGPMVRMMSKSGPNRKVCFRPPSSGDLNRGTACNQ